MSSCGGRHHHLQGAKRTGDNAGFASNTFLFIDLHGAIRYLDRAIRTAAGAGRIFTMVTGHGATLLTLLYNGNARPEPGFLNDVLLIIMCHHAGHFTGMAGNTF